MFARVRTGVARVRKSKALTEQRVVSISEERSRPLLTVRFIIGGNDAIQGWVASTVMRS